MPTKWMRAVELYFDAVVIVDSIAQINPVYRLTRGVILDTLFGKPETFNHVSTTEH